MYIADEDPWEPRERCEMWFDIFVPPEESDAARVVMEKLIADGWAMEEPQGLINGRSRRLRFRHRHADLSDIPSLGWFHPVLVIAEEEGQPRRVYPLGMSWPGLLCLDDSALPPGIDRWLTREMFVKIYAAPLDEQDDLLEQAEWRTSAPSP